ncbi:MAG: phosphoribosylformylglycinamidine cyclo-ligase [Nitrococcus mobilis]|nr:phosphoribosylformylglycinamidine cyclo-ligase [Nitrococcus mobilis]
MAEDTSRANLTYRDAGVDIDTGIQFVERIKADVATTMRPEVLGGLGGFGGLFELSLQRYRNPVLVCGSDGVGTKLKLAIETGRHEAIGIDLVAMCVNDIAVTGAEPLFFLDYYATGRLELDVAQRVIRGITQGCRAAGAALIGGETAEMPGIYASNHYDLAGFGVGIVEKAAIIDGSRVRPGDALIGIASSGLHSNGYSLVRRVLETRGIPLSTELNSQTLAELLMTPTRIYVRALRTLIEEVEIHSLCHITGGGLLDNLPRVLPAKTEARIDARTWEWPTVFSWLQREGGISRQEMYRVFNCGVGMVAALAPQSVDHALGVLQSVGEIAWQLGEVAAGSAERPLVRIEE